MTCLWLQQWGLGLTNKVFLVCLLGGGGGLSAAHQVGHASGTEGAGAHKARVRQFLIFPFSEFCSDLFRFMYLYVYQL